MTFLLDKNVVSELGKAKVGKAHRALTAWAVRNPAGNLYVSLVTLLELEIGVLQLSPIRIKAEAPCGAYPLAASAAPKTLGSQARPVMAIPWVRADPHTNEEQSANVAQTNEGVDLISRLGPAAAMRRATPPEIVHPRWPLPQRAGNFYVEHHRRRLSLSELSHDLHTEIQKLCLAGDALVKHPNFLHAIPSY